MTNRWNSGLIHDAKANAMSLWAYVPPERPRSERIPMALVLLIHSDADREKMLRPDWAKIAAAASLSNFGFDIFSHVLRNGVR